MAHGQAEYVRKKLGAALGMLEVLHADVDLLGQHAVLDALVDDNAERMACHVVYDARLAVVHLVGHALLDGTGSLWTCAAHYWRHARWKNNVWGEHKMAAMVG